MELFQTSLKILFFSFCKDKAFLKYTNILLRLTTASVCSTREGSVFSCVILFTGEGDGVLIT